MMALLNLVRWKNLLIIAVTQILIKYALFDNNYAQTHLNTAEFILLLTATIFIAAAGYVINDIYDVETDSVNKPNGLLIGRLISIKKAYNLFISFNIIGVLTGFVLSHIIGQSNLFGLFVVISVLLYVYASYLKQTAIIGNIKVAALVAISLIIVGVFDLLPAITDANRLLQLAVFKILLAYSIFAFLINLIREITKDIQDLDGDYKAGMHTLPIILGRARTKNILFILSLLPSLGIIYILSSFLYHKTTFVLCILFFVVGPLIVASIKIFNAKRKRDYEFISNLLKITMLTGIFSMLFPTSILV